MENNPQEIVAACFNIAGSQPPHRDEPEKPDQLQSASLYAATSIALDSHTRLKAVYAIISLLTRIEASRQETVYQLEQTQEIRASIHRKVFESMQISSHACDNTNKITA